MTKYRATLEWNGINPEMEKGRPPTGKREPPKEKRQRQRTTEAHNEDTEHIEWARELFLIEYRKREAMPEKDHVKRVQFRASTAKNIKTGTAIEVPDNRNYKSYTPKEESNIVTKLWTAPYPHPFKEGYHVLETSYGRYSVPSTFKLASVYYS